MMKVYQRMQRSQTIMELPHNPGEVEEQPLQSGNTFN